ncbi:MAG TPA: hypothetical protein V6C57_06630 [Coleofasciculaceae cyanobacterium]
MNAQIASFLQIQESAIIRVEEWAKVLFVVVAGKGGRFVSKRIINEVKVVKPLTWTLEATTRRQEGKKWIARICGQDAKYTFDRQFINAASIEWGKQGMRKAVFEIDAPGYYHDSDGDYFKVWTTESGFDAATCSYAEVKHHFYVASQELVTA